jgi:hypothetical protein
MSSYPLTNPHGSNTLLSALIAEQRLALHLPHHNETNLTLPDPGYIETGRRRTSMRVFW